MPSAEPYVLYTYKLHLYLTKDKETQESSKKNVILYTKSNFPVQI